MHYTLTEIYIDMRWTLLLFIVFNKRLSTVIILYILSRLHTLNKYLSFDL